MTTLNTAAQIDAAIATCSDFQKDVFQAITELTDKSGAPTSDEIRDAVEEIRGKKAPSHITQKAIDSLVDKGLAVELEFDRYQPPVTGCEDDAPTTEPDQQDDADDADDAQDNEPEPKATKKPKAEKEPKAPKERDQRLPKLGTLIERTYKGTVYCAAEQADGTFLVHAIGRDSEGTPGTAEIGTFTSLSRAAQEITGAKAMNGYAWWGLGFADTEKQRRNLASAVVEDRTRLQRRLAAFLEKHGANELGLAVADLAFNRSVDDALRTALTPTERR